MTILFYFSWLLIGSGMAVLFLKTQQWSANFVSPDHRRLSKWVIILGAVIRWLFIFALLLVARSHSVISMLILFVSFMTARLLILFKWQGMLIPGHKKLP